MKKIIKSNSIPAHSTIENGFGTIDYHDTYSIEKTTDKNAEEVSKELIQLPGWANALYFVRNQIVGIFGLETSKKKTNSTLPFAVIENREEEIIMGKNDKHLNFRASIMKDKSQGIISVTTIVHYNNIWGRVYFFPVKPFHKLIMRALLRNLSKRG